MPRSALSSPLMELFQLMACKFVVSIRVVLTRSARHSCICRLKSARLNLKKSVWSICCEISE